MILDQIRQAQILAACVKGFEDNVRVILVVQFDGNQFEIKQCISNANEAFLQLGSSCFVIESRVAFNARYNTLDKLAELFVGIL